MHNSITSMPSHENVLTRPEDVPSFDSRSFATTLDSSDQSSYYRDSDYTAGTASIELQIDVECFTPVECSLSGSIGPSHGGVQDQVKTAGPSPVSVQHALPEVLVGSALDVASKAITPDRTITPKSHPLVETVHVPLQPTPPELPTPPVSNDEAVTSDGDLTLYSTNPISKSTHTRLQLVHPPPRKPMLSRPSVVTHSQAAEVEYSLSGSRGPSHSSVQVKTAGPSPVSTQHALPEVLVGSALDVASKVFTPDRIITPKTHLLVETVQVPLQLTPPEPPTPPDNNDEAVTSDGDLTLYSTTPVSKSIHPRLQLVHPPLQTLPSPTTPQASKVPARIVTSLEHRRRPVEPTHLPARPVRSPPSYIPAPRLPPVPLPPVPLSPVLLSPVRWLPPASPLTLPAAPPLEPLGSINVVPGQVLRGSIKSIISRIRTRELVNQHKLLPFDTAWEYPTE